jgi:thiol-disulfide isomerase/thioredoxin
MRTAMRAAIILVLAAVVGAIVVAKGQPRSPAPPASVDETMQAERSPASPAPRAAPLPRLVDLGATQCIPCKMMAPILDELRTTYAGHFEVHFIDVWENRAAGQAYRIRVIPTQVFFDAGGKELLRHEGFLSREDILRIWHRLGYDFAAPSPGAEVGS